MTNNQIFSFLSLNFYVAPYIVTYLCQITFHAVGIFVVNDFEQLLQLCPNLRHLVVGVGVEQDFLKQVVIFVEHTLGNLHVSLKSGTRGILMLHHSSKDEGTDEGDTQRVSPI